ncbi:glycoside hydrolase family 128 protein [Athelia psychrophila]|uniref:Glycoside hydrolase family 128 protein n=1 Tax=Athelia psychrophila TaxID=1759441 RepID=A0A166G649_9AGAM|nr:glycoside hydrolase family 128 protein [Fibularhizoctonia sp. CBS 109695]
MEAAVAPHWKWPTTSSIANTTSSISASGISSSASKISTSSSASKTSTSSPVSNNSASSSASKTTGSSASTTNTSASAAKTSASSSTTTLTPNGKKAGIAGLDSLSWMKDHLGWAYDWTPSPDVGSGPVAVSMLWGDGKSSDALDAPRFTEFEALSAAPAYILAFEEPDCSSAGSSNIPDEATGASVWESVIAPWQAKGSLLGSPSMCKQADESWLAPFEADITTPWDFTAVHINKVDMTGVNLDLDHYWNTYGKPIWVTEFACVDDTIWAPCTNQTEIDAYINDIVTLFESDDRVYAYAYSDGEGLGTAWPTVINGALSASGQTYLDAISIYG